MQRPESSIFDRPAALCDECAQNREAVTECFVFIDEVRWRACVAGSPFWTSGDPDCESRLLAGPAVVVAFTFVRVRIERDGSTALRHLRCSLPSGFPEPFPRSRTRLRTRAVAGPAGLR
ncbi:MAG: hypothetical protein CL908_13570 [Deltaproteobacteria bacterium]|nr:hypothetical protein [Deltaproteobacteria bacterium]